MAVEDKDFHHGSLMKGTPQGERGFQSRLSSR
jgi:hypothetical protein